MKDFITYLIRNLVDAPNDVDVSVEDSEAQTLVKVKVAKDDIAKVIGRQGRTINALRTISLTIGARFNRRVRVEVVE